jgi:hypothetical protein
MKTKRLLFGLIEMNAKLYNILYTLLCVCVLFTLVVLSAYAMVEMEDTGLIEFNGWYIVLIDALLIFIGFQIMSKKHYA